MKEGYGSVKNLKLKKHIYYLFISAFIIFVLNKFYWRPFLLENDYPKIPQQIVLSLPNFCEAILGTIVITGILLELRHRFKNPLKGMKTSYIYLTALILSSIYVITQEFQFHNLGGNNVYDPFDIIASVIGLIFTYIIIWKFDFME